MSTGADNKSTPGTQAFRDGYDAIFGKDKKPEFGKFVWDSITKAWVSADHYQPPEQAKNAPIMSGRFYENTGTVVDDGKGNPVQVDIGSRERHKEFMRSRGLTVESDFKKTWEGRAQERAEFYQSGGGAKESEKRKDQLGKAFYELSKSKK